MKKDTKNMHDGCQSRLKSADTRFYRYSEYLRAKYGGTAYRVAVDAGFSCPNRSADRSRGGCDYCDEYGSRATYSRRLRSGNIGEPAFFDATTKVRRSDCGVDGLLPLPLRKSIDAQVTDGVRFLSARYGATTFLLYFQAYTSTYGDSGYLRRIYDYALSRADFRELIVGTRPDCIDERVAALLGAYVGPKRDVWAELGLQSACNATLRRVNRGHTAEAFERAFDLLRKAGINIAVHLIFGLPGESHGRMMQTVDYLARLRPEAVKLHDLHVSRGSKLGSDYLKGELIAPSKPRYLDYLVGAVERLPPETILMRICCDTEENRRLAPRFVTPKSELYAAVDDELRRRNSRQGARFSDH